MSSRPLGPEWVLSRFISPVGDAQDEINELVLATEVWEGVLQSVAKTVQRSNRKNWRIQNTEAYLFGAFHHRFNRALKKERRRREIIQHLPSSGDLERLRQAHDSRVVHDLEQSIQVNEAVRSMDEWTRKVWAARQYG
jgi:DNA-directed RNA polymerase specialized sigma24 family protein